MALVSPLPGVQGATALLGPGLFWKRHLVIPGTNDYVTGGYAITCTQLGFNPTYGIQSAWVSLCNAAANGYVVQPTVTFVQIGGTTSGAGTEGYTQILFWVGQSAGTAAPLVQLGSGANLTGCIWQLEVIGQ